MCVHFEALEKEEKIFVWICLDAPGSEIEIQKNRLNKSGRRRGDDKKSELGCFGSASGTLERMMNMCVC